MIYFALCNSQSIYFIFLFRLSTEGNRKEKDKGNQYKASEFTVYNFSRGLLCHYENNFALEGYIPTTYCRGIFFLSMFLENKSKSKIYSGW